VELKFVPIVVEDLLNTIAVHLQGRSEDERRPQEIIVNLPDDQALAIWGDNDKVEQIALNLADNAFSYTHPGGRITLSAWADKSAEHVVLSVADTGVGIPPEVADRIFERFYRGDESQELVMDTPGTGLGLAIVKEFVQMHHGRIWFESEMGKGTTFYVELPAKAPETTPSRT
jgi:two-component system phosphate regulon sensor histidine kinase PhoR